MKKLLFTALACVAFAFNGLASNEVNIFTDPPCLVTIAVYSPDGDLLDLIGSSDFEMSGTPCLKHADELVKYYKEIYPNANFEVSVDTRY